MLRRITQPPLPHRFPASIFPFSVEQQHIIWGRRVWFADTVDDRHHTCDANIWLVPLTCPSVLFLTALIVVIKKLWARDSLHSDWVPCAIGSLALGAIGHLSSIWLQITYWSEIIMPAAGVMSWSRYRQYPEQRTEHWLPWCRMMEHWVSWKFICRR